MLDLLGLGRHVRWMCSDLPSARTMSTTRLAALSLFVFSLRLSIFSIVVSIAVVWCF
jgi:hypothetical protein